MSSTVPTLQTPTPSSNNRQAISEASSTRTSTDTAPSVVAAASPNPSRSPRPSRSSSRQPSVVVSPAAATANGPPSAGLQPGATGQPSSRRNRAALRDYYGLKKATEDQASAGGAKDEEDSAADSNAEIGGGIVANRELDAPGFDAQAYVDGLLSHQGLEALLRAESGLINEIKFLTSERAALVYDNYSKLIAATDTIQRMRSNMAPLAPQTSTLAPAVGHIAVTAEQLAHQASAQQSPRAERVSPGGDVPPREETADERAKRQRDHETVRWVLDAPRRIRDEGPDAAEWTTVKGLLDRWKGMEGVEAVRKECERAVEQSTLAPPAKA